MVCYRMGKAISITTMNYSVAHYCPVKAGKSVFEIVET